MFTITNKRHIIMVPHGVSSKSGFGEKNFFNGGEYSFLFSPTSNASAVAYTSFQECAFSLSDIALIS